MVINLSRGINSRGKKRKFLQIIEKCEKLKNLLNLYLVFGKFVKCIIEFLICVY